MSRVTQYYSRRGCRRPTRTHHRRSRLHRRLLPSCSRLSQSRQPTQASLGRPPAGTGGTHQRTRMPGRRSQYPSAHGATPSLDRPLSRLGTTFSTTQLPRWRIRHICGSMSGSLRDIASSRATPRRRISERIYGRASHDPSRQDRTPLSDRRLHARATKLHLARPKKAHIISRLVLLHLRSIARKGDQGLRQ
jgi:hypothetical protein